MGKIDKNKYGEAMPMPIAIKSDRVSRLVRWPSRANPMAAPNPGAVQGVATAVARTPERKAPHDPDDL